MNCTACNKVYFKIAKNKNKFKWRHFELRNIFIEFKKINSLSIFYYSLWIYKMNIPSNVYVSANTSGNQ